MFSKVLLNNKNAICVRKKSDGFRNFLVKLYKEEKRRMRNEKKGR